MSSRTQEKERRCNCAIDFCLLRNVITKKKPRIYRREGVSLRQGTMQLYPKEVFYLLSHEGTYDIYDGGLPMTVSGDAVQSYNMVKTSNVASKGFSSMTLV